MKFLIGLSIIFIQAVARCFRFTKSRVLSLLGLYVGMSLLHILLSQIGFVELLGKEGLRPLYADISMVFLGLITFLIFTNVQKSGIRKIGLSIIWLIFLGLPTMIFFKDQLLLMPWISIFLINYYVKETSAFPVLEFLICLISFFYIVVGFIGFENYFGLTLATIIVVPAILFRFPHPILIGAFLCAKNIWHWHWIYAVFFSLPWAPLFIFMQISGGLAWRWAYYFNKR